jgi:hypothetical protein
MPHPLKMLLVETYKGRVEMRFSHVVSTPVGNFAVFTDDSEDNTVAYYKLVEPTPQEEQMLLDVWADMGEGDGFLLTPPDDE